MPHTFRHPANDDGFMLIEVIVGAVLVLLITVGLLNGFDSSTRASSVNKNRSEASDLAQADQESLRSMTVAKLSNLRNVKTVTVGTNPAVTYTVNERADWVRDDSGVVSCTNDSTQASYIEITSSVTWAGMGITPPVALQSLVAPPVGSFGANQGSAVIQVTDGNVPANPIAGLSVSLGGAGAYTDVTDANGCAVFGYIPVGNYTVSLSRGGWVDPLGYNPGMSTCSVSSGNTTLCSALYAQAGTTTVSFDTKPYCTVNCATAPYVASKATNVLFINQNLTATLPDPPPTFVGGRMFPTAVSTSLQSSITATNLFPFPTGYAIVAGACPTADPRNAPTLNATYFNPPNPTTLHVGPGNTYTTTIHEPPLNVTVSSGGNPVNNATVSLTNTDCNTVLVETTDSSGHIPNPGMPFGNYTICASGTVLGIPRKTLPSPVVVNNNLNGTTVNLTPTVAGALISGNNYSC